MCRSVPQIAVLWILISTSSSLGVGTGTRVSVSPGAAVCFCSASIIRMGISPPYFDDKNRILYFIG